MYEYSYRAIHGANKCNIFVSNKSNPTKYTLIQCVATAAAAATVALVAVATCHLPSQPY